MTSSRTGLDPHARPPDELRAFYKRYQKLRAHELLEDECMLDFRHDESCRQVRLTESIDFKSEPGSRIHESRKSTTQELVEQFCSDCTDHVQIYEYDSIPGLRIIPNMLPQSTQIQILDTLLHRDLSNPAHKSNLHLHYNVHYPANNASFFAVEPGSTEIVHEPKDPAVHRPINLQQMLSKKLRWITLGGQYDWTNKVYLSDLPPQFPQDIAGLLHFLFPHMIPQAAIVNFYSPGDTLSLHRDVAEDCDRGLVSISIGCDAIFVLGLEDQMVAMRLRSGDAVYMDGASRYAWHGVPQIVPETCPEWLRGWPGDQYEHWRGWMSNKRINLNVRQMWSSSQ